MPEMITQTAQTHPRRAACNSLIACEKHGKYANLEVSAAIERSAMTPADRSLYTALVYGVLERRITLDYLIDALSSRPAETLDAEVRAILWLGLYQLRFMDRIPAHAAVSESVKLASKKSGGFINAVLRNYLRKQNEISFPAPEVDFNRYLSIHYAAPIWLCALWCNSYGCETAERMLAVSFGNNRMSLRVNTEKTTVEAVLNALSESGLHVQRSALSDALLLVEGTHPLASLPGLTDGDYFVQDEASAVCTDVLAPAPGETVLDACAAPGGKSLACALRMENRGRVIACDLHANKLRLLEKSCTRLGVEIVETRVQDGRQMIATLCGIADRVLCDVPCSGLGVLAKKPDIRYKRPDDIAALPEIQYAILANCAQYVRKGGVLVYSTCTLNPAENEAVVSRFLASCGDDFVPVDFTAAGQRSQNGMCTLLPQLTGTDGFFIACMRCRL